MSALSCWSQALKGIFISWRGLWGSFSLFVFVFLISEVWVFLFNCNSSLGPVQEGWLACNHQAGQLLLLWSVVLPPLWACLGLTAYRVPSPPRWCCGDEEECLSLYKCSWHSRGHPAQAPPLLLGLVWHLGCPSTSSVRCLLDLPGITTMASVHAQHRHQGKTVALVDPFNFLMLTP